MGKYGKGYESWKIGAGESNLTIRPRKGDVSEFMQVAQRARKSETMSLYDTFGKFIEKLIKRDHPPLNEDEQNDLEEFVEANIVKLSEELPVALNITTQEELDKIKQEEVALKKKES